MSKKSKPSKLRQLAEERQKLVDQRAVLVQQVAALDARIADLEIADRVLASLGNEVAGFPRPVDTPVDRFSQPLPVPASPGKLTNREQIINAMPAGVRMTKSQVLEAIAKSVSVDQPPNAPSIGVELSKMVKAKLLRSDGRGVYVKGEPPTDIAAGNSNGGGFIVQPAP